MRRTSGSRRFHEPRGCTVVPRPCSTRTSPRSSRSFNPSRTTVRLKPNSSHSAGSVGRTSPSASAPPMICWASSWTMTEANRAGRNLPLPRGRRSVCSIPIILWSDQVDTLARVTYYHHMTTFAPRSTLGLGTGPLAGLLEEDMDETRRAADAVRGLAHWVGVGTNIAATAAELVARGEVDVVLLAGRYTLLDRSAENELLPLCAERSVPVLAAGVFNSGVLAGGSTFDYESAPDEILSRRRALEAMCAGYDVPLAAAAVQFPLR